MALELPVEPAGDPIEGMCTAQGIDRTFHPGDTIRPPPPSSGERPPASSTAPTAFADHGSPLTLPTAEALAELPLVTVGLPAGDSGQEQSELCIDLELGRGGMGVVYLARQRSLRREVALKVIHTSAKPTEGDTLQALLREARIAGSLEHPNIVPVHWLGRDKDNQPQMVMKRVGGVPWADLIRQDHVAGGAGISEEKTVRHLEILVAVCRAIEFAHSRGILHRDIKPANVVVGNYGEVILLDWGVAVALEETPHEARGAMVGTPGYMAPELLAGDARLHSARTDVYLLGATLHEILTGRPRHQGKDVYAVLLDVRQSPTCQYPSSVPPELAEICNRACHCDPQQRFAGVQSLRQAIADYACYRSSMDLARRALLLVGELCTLIRGGDRSRPPAGGARARTRTAGQAGAMAGTRASATAAAGDEEEGMAGASTCALLADVGKSGRQLDPAERNLRIHRLFSQGRFAFEQACKEWPDNDKARRGLQQSLELMIEYELTSRNATAAQALLADLPQPCPELAERISVLERELREQEDAREQLSRIRQEGRFRGLDRRRSMAALLSGTGWCLAILVLGTLVRRGHFQPTPAANLTFAVLGFAESLIVAYFARRIILDNRIFRQFYWITCYVFGGLIFNRLLACSIGYSFQQTLLVDYLILFVAFGCAAATVDARLLWIAALAAAGAGLAVAWPQLGVSTIAMVVLFAHALVAWLVWPRATTGDGARQREQEAGSGP